MSSYSLGLVLHKVEDEQRLIGKKLTRLQEFINNEKAQENNLREYQAEYIKKIDNQRRCNISEINRYRTFCYQLESALVQQQRKIALAEAEMKKLRHLLMTQQHKISVLTELIQKKEGEISYLEEKQLQKIMDELSARQHTQKHIQL
jgi:flagellar protein FliJ